MSTVGFATVTGEKQGRIEGGATHDNDEGLIQVLGFDHAVELPRRGGANMAAGRPIHGDIVLAKLLDKSTPKLYQALCTGEMLKTVVFHWYHYTDSAVEELFYTIQLENALITRAEPWMPDFLDPAYDRYRFMEKISLTYEKILWSWGPSGDVQFEDSWAPKEDR